MEQSVTARWSLRIIGFVLGFSAAVALECLFVWLLGEMFGHRFYPRGLGWIIIPFSAGFGGAVLFSSLRPGQAVRLLGGPREMRLCVAGGVSWALLVLGYVFVAEPFGSYIVAREWVTILKWLFIPPILALVVRGLFRWACKKDAYPLPAQPLPDFREQSQQEGGDGTRS